MADTEYRSLRADRCGGLKVNGVSYMVGFLPMRKQPCLYRHEGVDVTIAAYFRSDEHAATFLDWLVDEIGRDAKREEKPSCGTLLPE